MLRLTQPASIPIHRLLPFGAGEHASRRHHLGFWVVAYAFAASMAFSALPTPLYVLYEQRDHFGAFLVTVIFAAYALGVVTSLFLAGHVSDWVGRRRVLVTSLLINMAAGAVFLLWPAVAGLLVARFISGISIGMLTATATAHLTELHRAVRPDASRARADLVATTANLGGLGLGPLLSGLLAQYVADPLQVPYLVFEGALFIGAVAIALWAPETVAVTAERPAYRPQRVAVPAAARPLFIAAGLAALAEFAVFGLFTSLAPSFLAGTLHEHSHAVAGLAAFVVFAAGALAQILLARASVRKQLFTGFGVLIAGLVLVTVAVWHPSLVLFLAGGALAGGGAGAAFKGSVSTVLGLAPAAARAEALAGLFLAAYLGLSLPVIGVGAATQIVSDQVALLGFAAVLVVVIALVASRLLRPAPVTL